MIREEAIAILIRERDEDVFVRTEYRKQLHEALSMGIKALERIRWIPVCEKLPKAGDSNEYIEDVEKYYLVQNEYGDMLVARYTRGEYWEQMYQLKPIDDEIVAWMSLPEPYRKE